MSASSRYPGTGTPRTAPALYWPRTVLVSTSRSRNGRNARKYLELLVAHRIRIAAGRRLHGHDAQKLQQMVLHHVAQRPGLVVKVPAPLDAEFFSHGDLHVLDADRAATAVRTAHCRSAAP